MNTVRCLFAHLNNDNHEYAGQKWVLGIHKTQNGVETLMHRAWVTHHHCPLCLGQCLKIVTNSLSDGNGVRNEYSSPRLILSTTKLSRIVGDL